MKKIITILILVLTLKLAIAQVDDSLTVGVIKSMTLPNGVNGSFIRTGQVVFDFNERNFSDSAMIKIDLMLYKSIEAYGDQKPPIEYKHEVQFYYKLNDPVIRNLINMLYDRMITIDTAFFKNFKKIKIK